MARGVESVSELSPPHSDLASGTLARCGREGRSPPKSGDAGLGSAQNNPNTWRVAFEWASIARPTSVGAASSCCDQPSNRRSRGAAMNRQWCSSREAAQPPGECKPKATPEQRTDR